MVQYHCIDAQNLAHTHTPKALDFGELDNKTDWMSRHREEALSCILHSLLNDALDNDKEPIHIALTCPAVQAWYSIGVQIQHRITAREFGRFNMSKFSDMPARPGTRYRPRSSTFLKGCVNLCMRGFPMDVSIPLIRFSQRVYKSI